jgi:hypothetical protein
MRRERTRPKQVAFTAAFTGLAVFLWQLFTASLAPDSPAPFTAGVGFLPVPSAPRASPSVGGAPVVSASLGASSSQGWGALSSQTQARSLPEAVEASSEARSSASAPESVLPAVSEELAPDGLPVSAIRCTRTEQGLDCGSCRLDGDCPPGHGCVANRETRRFECQASECEQDAHCFPGSVCRAVNTGATGSVIRRCVPEGVRREGESCDAVPVSAAGSCREGLRCVNQVCSTPCRLEEPSGCPAGLVCTDSLNGPGCFPDCQRLGCPDGQRCTRVRDERYQCLAESQGDCRDNPCPDGERCNLRMSRGRAVFWCAKLCDSFRPESCPGDQVCGMGGPTVSTCFRKCDPMQADACGPGWACSTVSEDMTVFGCQPDLRR